VADVTPKTETGGPGVFTQIRLVAGLRWRILRNLMRVRNSRLDIVGLIFAAIFAARL